jgi:hypothetical protein
LAIASCVMSTFLYFYSYALAANFKNAKNR